MNASLFGRIAIAVAALLLCGGDARAANPRYGVIEIGGSGVKASIVQLAEPSSPGDDGGVQIVVEREFPTRNANAVYPEQAQTVADIVAENVRTMRTAGVSALRIYVVGTSGLANVPHAGDLRARVNRAIAGNAGAMQFISGEEQAALGFAGILNCRRLAHRRDESVYIDIGSADVSVAHVELPSAQCGGEKIGARSLPWGVKTLERQASDRARGAASSPPSARAALATAQVEALARTSPPGVVSLPRVYLGGGIVWAVATLTHPESRGRYVRLTAADFEAVRAQILENPACITDINMALRADAACRKLDLNFAGITDPAARAAARADHREIVSNVFSADQLSTGAEIMTAMSSRLQFAGRTVFFARPARRAWMLGYLLAREGRDEAASGIVPP